MNIPQEYSHLKEENEKLRLESMQLKQELEKEEFLHKALYKQWRDLYSLTLSQESELKRVGLANSLYTYAFYLILFLVTPAVYLLSGGKRGEPITPASHTAASPMLIANETPASNRDTVQAVNIKLGQKQAVQQGAIQPISATINDTAINQPLSDSVRNSIYWEGWSAYYEKSGNPYPNSPRESEVWLEGWKQGADDAKKPLAKTSL